MCGGPDTHIWVTWLFMDDKKQICIARIAAAHGVKGLVKIVPYGEDPSLIEEVQEHKITLKNRLGKYILAEIEGCDNRDKAEALRGTELFISRDDLPTIDGDDSFYIDDLVGLKVIEDGEEIGHIKAVHNFGAGDLLDIALKNGGDMLLPFNDDTTPEINIAGGFVRTVNHAHFMMD